MLTRFFNKRKCYISYYPQSIQNHRKNYGTSAIFLPPYSPNLNLIERVWKFFKIKVIRGKYYERFDKFKAIVHEFFENFGSYKEELESLLVKKISDNRGC
ncbi:MAG: transposase [bacterium]